MPPRPPLSGSSCWYVSRPTRIVPTSTRVASTSSEPRSVPAARLKADSTAYEEVARYPLLGEILMGDPPELQWRGLRLATYGASDVHSLW